MPAMLFLTIILSLMASIGMNMPSSSSRRDESAQAYAYRMAWYHSQAIIRCQNPAVACTDGEIDIHIPSDSMVQDLSGHFISLYNEADGLVVTTYRDTAVGKSYRSLNGLVAAALVDLTQSSSGAGSYNTTTNSVGNTYVQYSPDGPGQGNMQYGGASTPVPSTLHGYSFENGQAMLARRIRN